MLKRILNALGFYLVGYGCTTCIGNSGPLDPEISKAINDNNLTRTKFKWQEGYGAFSYGHSQIKDVYRYIANQELHHKKLSFKEEYLAFLEKFELPYDERYVFNDLV